MALRRLTVTNDERFPAYVVWELTLRCDQPCAHCGSRAGKARPEELTVDEALSVVEQMAAMGTREVVLIGGEAYLHEGFLDIARALVAAGVRATMTTGGRGITRELAREMKAAGIFSVSVSVDGTEREHDLIRKAKGSFAGAMDALSFMKDAGLRVTANTNVNRVNLPVLEDLYMLLRTKGIEAWQVQVTVPLGRAADRPQMLLQPFDLLDFVPRLAALKTRAYDDGIIVMPGNNLGYMGREESLLRSLKRGGGDHWQGCKAGKLVMGIESNGGVKGCPSLQSSYVGGNLREHDLAHIWNETAPLQVLAERTVDDLWGYCRTCPFAETCMGGCSFTAHALFGRPGNNPYCHFRAGQMAKAGKRERLVPGQAAPGLPFDHGLFEIIVEEFDAPEEKRTLDGAALVSITRKAGASPTT
jgi:radical SAM protein with 4Fe4S-binding SPASM domain